MRTAGLFTFSAYANCRRLRLARRRLAAQPTLAVQPKPTRKLAMLKAAPLYAYVPVHDLARARRFYEDTLGLDPSESVGPGLSFQCGGGTGFFMYPTSGAGTNQ